MKHVGHSDPVEYSVIGDHFLPGAGLFRGGVGGGKEKFVCFFYEEGTCLATNNVICVSFVKKLTV